MQNILFPFFGRVWFWFCHSHRKAALGIQIVIADLSQQKYLLSFSKTTISETTQIPNRLLSAFAKELAYNGMMKIFISLITNGRRPAFFVLCTSGDTVTERNTHVRPKFRAIGLACPQTIRSPPTPRLFLTRSSSSRARYCSN